MPMTSSKLLTLLDYLYHDKNSAVEDRILQVIDKLGVGTAASMTHALTTSGKLELHMLRPEELNLHDGGHALTVFRKYLEDFPSIHFFKKPQVTICRMSDHSPAVMNRYLKSPIYKLVFQALGLEDSINADVSLGQRLLFLNIGSKRPFTSDEYDLIRSLLPHFGKVYLTQNRWESEGPEMPPTALVNSRLKSVVWNPSAQKILRENGYAQFQLKGCVHSLDPTWRIKRWIWRAVEQCASGEKPSLNLRTEKQELILSLHACTTDTYLITLSETAASPFSDLTAREKEILRLLAEGKSNKKIGAALGISEATTRTHVQNIRKKLGVESRAAAVAIYHERRKRIAEGRL